ERKKLEEQFLRAQRLEVIGTLAGGLAHDLNNILAAMLMAAGLLKDKTTDPRDRNMVRMIEISAQRGTSIIRQLLTFTRGLDSTRVCVQSRHLIEDTVQLMQETFPRTIAILNQAPKNLWCVIADPTQIHQVLMNLCVNARDAMPEGGQLTLFAHNLVLPTSANNPDLSLPPGRYVVLGVSDTGEGITPEILPHIFDPFFSTKTPDKGTGLGLSSVQAIVKSHGGCVTVESTPGRGATFKVYLPAADHDQADSPAAVATDTAPVGHGELILLVEDEDLLREATRNCLEHHHYRVLTAPNGEEAIRVFVQHHDSIRLVLTDLVMPVMNGLDLIRSLRVITPKLPVIVLCGSDDAPKRAELAKLGIADILLKPCEPTLLLQTLHHLLQPAT
ncbi:MAG: ATP-binding protein, partial [Opitutales bacterium]